VLADEFLRGSVHRVGIEQPGHAPDPADVEREIGAGVGDAIEIMPSCCGKPRLERIGHDFGG
jgi:hypothetical protein